VQEAHTVFALKLSAVLVVAAGSSCLAQTIQLPSFSNVGVNTTVVVPDSGGAYAARDRRAGSGLDVFGGFPLARGWSVRRQTSGVGVTAQIHDQQAADRALLSRGAGDQASPAQTPLAIAAGRAVGDAPLGSVSELAQRRAQQLADSEREALGLIEKARRAQAAGKASVAKVYYRMAAGAAQGELRDRIVDEYERLADTSASSKSRGER
jgi:hypothetical protein